MNHNFDIKLATKYNVNIAIFLSNMSFWIQKNIANEKHFYDGKYWTYNSVKSYTVLFPYFTAKQIRKIIDDCVVKKLIIKGNYNTNSYDKTSWYAFTDLGLEAVSLLICPKGHTPLPKRANGVAQKGKPIPDIKPNKKPNKKTEHKKITSDVFEFTHAEMQEAIDRDISIQKCFNKFKDFFKKGFTRKEWEEWFAREKNGKKAKNKHLKNQIDEHEERKKLEMGDRYKKNDES